VMAWNTWCTIRAARQAEPVPAPVLV